MVTVVARIRAKSGKENEVRQVLLDLVAPTHAESGCLNYDLHQSADDPTDFLFYENWTHQEVLDEHLQTPHLKKFVQKADNLLKEPVDIKLWQMISIPKVAQKIS